MLTGFELRALRDADEDIAAVEHENRDLRTRRAYELAHHDGIVAQLQAVVAELKRLAPDNPLFGRIRGVYNEAVRESGRKLRIPASYIEEFLRKQNS